jgi:hypothetical protein
MTTTQIQNNLRLTRQILDHALFFNDAIGIALAATAHAAALRIARIWGVTA